MCSKCDSWESQRVHLTANAKETSRTFGCQGGHTSSIRPTTLKPLWRPSHQYSSRVPTATAGLKSDKDERSGECRDKCEEEQEDPDSDSDSEYQDAPPLDDYSISDSEDEDEFFWVDSDEDDMELELALQEKVSALSNLEGERERADAYHQKYIDCRLECNELKQQIEFLRSRLSESMNDRRNLRRRARRSEAPKPEDATSVKVYLQMCLGYAMRTHPQGRRTKAFATNLASAVWEFEDGFVKQEMLKHTRAWYRTNVFSDWRIARLMDINGSVLNLSCIDLIRSLEEPAPRSRDTMFPHSSSIQRVMTTVERIGSVLVPFEMTSQTDGEAFRFDYKKTMKLLLTAFGLEDAARRRSVHFSIAMDGARLTTRLNHTTAGIKVKDHAAIDPLTDTPVFAGEEPFADQSV